VVAARGDDAVATYASGSRRCGTILELLNPDWVPEASKSLIGRLTAGR
jgi:hypothetical protein